MSVPFVMVVKPPRFGVIPWISTFPETNVRTYVVGPDGRPDVWFLRMNVTALWFVITLRAIGLPYVHHTMTVEATSGGGATAQSSTDSRLNCSW